MILRWHEPVSLAPEALADYERALLTAHAADEAHLGFVRLAPCALIGAFDDPERSLRRSFVDGHLPVVRRQTGGGSLSVDAGTTLMVAAVPRALMPQQTLTAVIAAMGEAIAAALRGLDIPVAFAAPNDITHDGRKTGSVFALFIEDTILIEAALLFAVDTETLLKTLKLPLEKLSAEGLLAAGRRFAPIGDANPHATEAGVCRAIAERLAVQLNLDAATQRAPAVQNAPLPPWASAPPPDLGAFLKTPGGVIYLDLMVTSGIVRAARLSGGVQCARAADFSKLTDQMTGVRLTDLEATVAAAAPRDTLGFDPADLGYLARLCVERHTLGARLGIPGDAARVTLYSPRRDQGFAALLADIGALLLPYCAKPAWCKWRHRDGCPECGQCAVGEAYRLGRERGLPVTTITRYEHLQMVLAQLREAGVRAFLGVCCTEFFLKRDYAFVEGGLGAVFIDISGDTCYTLHAEESAYRGQFTAEAALDPDLLSRVLDLSGARAR